MAEQHRVQLRWSDLDRLGHVNHSTVLAHLEVGRDAVLRSRGIEAQSYVIRRCEVDYARELRPATGHLDYVCDELILGTSSIRTHERLLDDDGRTAVDATVVLVMWDADRGTARPLTATERRHLATLTQEH